MSFCSILKYIEQRLPGVVRARARVHQLLNWRRFPGSTAYWQCRYRTRGTSGVGSYGKLAEFKASVLNRFVAARQVASVIEFGCGDGNQLLYARYPRYTGLDVVREAILLCRERFQKDVTKSFFLYDPECFMDGVGVFRADLALSLDVLYHLVEDSVFARYMELLFESGQRFVIIYSSNHDETTSSPHVRHRQFADYVAVKFPEWQLMELIKNPYPLSQYPEPLGSLADFYIYERKNMASRPP